MSRDLSRNAKRAEKLLKQLAHAGRLTILCALTEGEMPVGALVEASGLSQSAASQHLAKLKLAGLVDSRREGQSILYRLDDPDAQALLKAMYRIFCKE